MNFFTALLVLGFSLWGLAICVMVAGGIILAILSSAYGIVKRIFQ